MQQSPPAFAAEAHSPFDFPADSIAARPGRVSALLLHGFMGTPKELRPLGRALAADGIRAVAPLLPGFGAHVSDLVRTTADDWSRAVDKEWTRVRSESDVTVLIGFSFGAALALQTASRTPPDALVLISPYVRLIGLPSWLLTAGLPVLKRTIKTFSPYAKADFNDPEVRRFFHEMNPEFDLDDPTTQAELRKRSTIPFSVIDEMRRTTDRGRKAALSVSVPTLLVQGTRDETSTVARSRTLAGTLRGPLALRELDADHLIVDDQKPSWPALRESVLGFIDQRIPPNRD